MLTALCFLAIFVFAVDSQVFPTLLTRLGGTPVQQGVLLSALFLFYPLTSVAAGALADRVGKRPVVTVGLVLMGLPFALSALFPLLWMRTLAVLFFGLGAGAVESQTSALLTDLHPERERNVLNLSQTFYGIGAAAGPFLIALVYRLIVGVPLAGIFWAVAAVNAVLPLGFALSRSGTALQTPAAGAPSKARLRLDGRLRLLVLMIFLYVAMEAGLSGWVVKYSELDLALPVGLAPLSLAAFWGGHAICRALVGLLSGRLSDRRLLVGALIFALAAQGYAFFLARGVAVLVGTFLIGLGLGSVWPTLVAMAAVGQRQASGTVVGLMVAAGGLAVTVIHPLIGFLSRPEVLGLRVTLLSLCLITALLVPLVLLVPAPCPRTEA